MERTRPCREILVAKLYQLKVRTVESGGYWENIADRLNECQIPTIKVTKRAVRDRYKILTDKYKKKMREEGLKDFWQMSDNLLFEILHYIRSHKGYQGQTCHARRREAPNSLTCLDHTKIINLHLI